MAASLSEERKAKMRAYYAKNRERIRAQQNARRNELGDNAERCRDYYERTREERREQQRAASRRSLGKLRFDVITAYGGLCACCGSDYFPHLTLDHIEGGGADERRALGSGQAVARRLRKEGYPEGYQVLCFNCNYAKYHLGRCACSDEVA